MKSPTFFDIETGPLPEAEIVQFMPEFSAPGNYKDPEKIKASLEAQKSEWLDRAALSPITGRVLCVGVLEDGKEPQCIYCDEHELLILADFWDIARKTCWEGSRMVGWCIHHFDLPFLVKRSIKLGVTPPDFLREGNAKQYWDSKYLDLQVLWQLGDRQCESSLDRVSRFLGLPGKNGDGAEFYKLWKENRPAALEYVKRDLELTRDLYNRVGKALGCS